MALGKVRAPPHAASCAVALGIRVVARQAPGRSDSLYALLSQGANSGGNLILMVFVARHATQSDYGAWALGYAAYMVAIAVARALASTPLLLGRHESAEKFRYAAGACLVLAMSVGLVGSAVLLLLAGVSDGVLSVAFPVAIGLPLLLGQDALRYVAFAGSRPADAALLDLSWLLIQIPLFVGLEWMNWSDPALITAAWVVALLPGGLWIMHRRRSWPLLRAVPTFWRTVRSDGLKLLADSVIASAATLALPLVVAITAGLAAAGALRGALTLMGVINILVLGLTPVATMSARIEYDHSGRVRAFVWRWSSLILAVSAVNGVLVLTLPDAWGREILGSSWLAASALLVPMVLQSLISGPATGVPIALRATARVKEALRLRLWTTVPAVVFPWGGAIAYGVEGAAWGIVVAAAASNLICLTTLKETWRRTPVRPQTASEP